MTGARAYKGLFMYNIGNIYGAVQRNGCDILSCFYLNQKEEKKCFILKKYSQLMPSIFFSFIKSLLQGFKKT